MNNENINSKSGKVKNHSNNNLYSNAEFLYSLTSNRLQNQLQQIESLDNKIINLLGFSCTLIAILATAISIIGITDTELFLSYFFIFISILSFVYIVIITLIYYHPKEWQIGPDLGNAWKYSCLFERQKMLKWSAKSFTQAYYHNKKHEKVQKKTAAVRNCIRLLIIQIFSSILAIVLVYLY
jgi:hypothetical protein